MDDCHATDAQMAAVQRAAPALLSFFERRVGQDAVDLVAETTMVAWRRRDSMPSNEEDIRRWLFGVAHHVLANSRRSGTRRRRLADRLRAIRATNPAPAMGTGLDVRRAIEELPDDLADIVYLIYWEDFSAAEVAEILDLPASTVRSRHASARRTLARALNVSTNSDQPPDDAILDRARHG